MVPAPHVALWLIYSVLSARCASCLHQSVYQSPLESQSAEVSPSETKEQNRLTWDGSNATHGILLWSLGRCATGTLGDTLVASGARYCRGRKETFSKSGVSEIGLQRCLYASGVVVTHIKPQHVWLAKSSLRAPQQMMAAAAKVGFSAVVVLRRQNHLARLVSSFENRLKERRLQVDKARKLAAWFFATPRRTIEWESAMLEIGAQSAMMLGFAHVFQLDFIDVTASFLCSQVKRILELFGETSAPCVPSIAHLTSPSKRSRPLERRVGRWAARRIVDDLVNSPYEWMLELNATAWPATLPRPDPVLHPEGPRPIIEDYMPDRLFSPINRSASFTTKLSSSMNYPEDSNSSTAFFHSTARKRIHASVDKSASSQHRLRRRRKTGRLARHRDAVLRRRIVTFRP